MRHRLGALGAAALLTSVLAQLATAAAASDTANTSIPVDPATQVEMHVTANCSLAQNRCSFNTTANLLTPGGPTGFPDDVWARQTITLRSSDRNVWQEAQYSAPSGMPPETKGADHDNVLSKMFKSVRSSASRSTAAPCPPTGAPASRPPTPTSSRAR
jgi:hypothetical protein